MRYSGVMALCFAALFQLSACGDVPESQTSDAPPMPAEQLAEAKRIHKEVLTLDSHIDIPDTFATEAADPGQNGKYQVDLPKMQTGGLDAGFFIVYVAQTTRSSVNYDLAKQQAMVKFDAIHRMADVMYPDQIGLAYKVEDVRRIHDEGRLVALIGIENGYAIGKDILLLEKYYDLGARYITLAHMGHNDIADSANPREELGDAEAEHNGLSAFGSDVVAEMNRLGIMVDVSHISKAAMMQAVRESKAPVIASHSSVHALAPVPRNMDDEQLLALKRNGGVIQIVAFSSYLRYEPEKDNARAALATKMREKYLVEDLSTLNEEQMAEFDDALAELDKIWPLAPVSEFVDHIDYAVKLIGIEHVGISSDFDGGGGLDGWNDASETENVTIELVKRGYSQEEIAKLWGGNLLRVLSEVEMAAEKIRNQQ